MTPRSVWHLRLLRLRGRRLQRRMVHGLHMSTAGVTSRQVVPDGAA